MDTRVILAPPDSPILRDPSTVRLHEYPNGEVLVRTAAAASEEGESDETPVAQGLRIAGVSGQQLDSLRAGLSAGPGTSAGNSAVPESDRAGGILAYVELIGPIDAVWVKALKDLQIHLLGYHPENTYLCKAADQAAFAQAAKLDFVIAVTPLTDSLKPGLDQFAEDGEDVQIVVQGAAGDSAALVRQLAAVPGVFIRPDQEPEPLDFYIRIRARLSTRDAQAALLKLPQVLAVERFVAPRPEDEVADLIICGQYVLPGKTNGSYLKWLEDHGINGQGVTIGIVDGGVDTSHTAFSGRITDLTGGSKSWHATFVAGHAAGAYLDEKDTNQFIYGLGLAPAANLLSQDNSLSPTVLCRQTVTTEAPSGVPGSVQNNSWGKGTKDPMDYSSDEAAYDGLVRNADPGGSAPRPITVCFSSGNSGNAGLTRPKAAKNVIITGNSENYRPDVGRDQSDNVQEIFSGPHPSSWGNCGDGRIRPHLVAPGEWTSSANYDSHPGEVEYISPKLTWGGGSSGASPKTAAACALLIQWWRNHHQGNDPSPAILRGLLVNGAEPISSGGSVPNNIQGWGRLHLGNVVNQAVACIYSDQEFLLKSLGDEKVWNIVVSDPSKPLKVTLAWTDPPGPIGSGSTPAISPIVNKLAMRVHTNNLVFRGNQFQDGWSTPGGSTDREGADNLQNIFLKPGVASGVVRVSVTALNITTNCLTGVVDSPQQDFALIIQNGQLSASSPSDVVVVVDQAAAGDSKTDNPGDYWKGTAGSTDSQQLDANWWDTVDPSPASGSDAASTAHDPTALSSPTDLGDWWRQVDAIWGTSPEATEAEKAPLTRNTNFVQALGAGLEAAAGPGRDIRVGGSGPASESGGAPATNLLTVSSNAVRNTDSFDAASRAAVDFSAALARILKDWRATGASYGGSVRRRTAVFVVGSGTRVAPADTSALAGASMMGEIYLVSDDTALLAFLAQRIHRLRGVHFRVAADKSELPALAAETVAEAAGLQQVSVAARASQSGSLVTTRGSFNVIEADLVITVQILYTPAVQHVKSIRLQRPGQARPKTVKPDGKSVSTEKGLEHFTVIAPPDKGQWKGAWEVQVDSTGSADPVAIRVWAETSLALTATESAPDTGAAGAGSQALIVISSSSGVQFRRSVVRPARIAAREPLPSREADRDIVINVLESRASREEGLPSSEASRSETSSPLLSRWFSLPQVADSAVMADLRFQIEGADAHGQHFERVLRRNVLRLEPRSAWRKRVSAAPAGKPNLLTTPALIDEIRFAAGELVGLLFRRGNQRRQVLVNSVLLRRELTRLSAGRSLEGKSCTVRIAGNELVSLFLSLDDLGAVSKSASGSTVGGQNDKR
jgi:hypothetical protein